MLHSQRLAYRARGEVLPNPTRLTKVQHWVECIVAVMIMKEWLSCVQLGND